MRATHPSPAERPSASADEATHEPADEAARAPMPEPRAPHVDETSRAPMSEPRAPHRFRFFRAGGFDQVLLDRGADLLALDQLDQKLWVALSCPVEGIDFDPRTLSFVDTDRDGRIRAPEVVAAARWAAQMLRDPDELIRGGDTLHLASIATDHPEGRQLLSSARQILVDLGKDLDGPISLEDVTDTAAVYASMRFNGDGIVPPASADDEEVARAIEEIVGCVGGAEDRCGALGVAREQLETFFEAAVAFDAWWSRAEASAEVLPLGEATAAAADALAAVRDKVDDWFTRSRLAAFDPRAIAPLNREEEEYAAVASKLLSPTGEEVASFPLAAVTPAGELPLREGINPAWEERIATLRDVTIEPLLGPRETLSLEAWREVKARLAPYEEWSRSNGGAAVEELGIARVRELLASDAQRRIEALIERDEALAPEADGIEMVEKLLRFKRDLYRLVCNFVSFTDFYTKGDAIFQAGTLYLDQRSCELCIQVADPEAHARLATSSKMFLAYCACRRKSDGKQMYIAAAFTAGDSLDLVVGRNGIFYDRKGDDWDATIVKLVEHPIGIAEAFWLPYRRVGRLVGEQIERFAEARDQKLQERTVEGIETTAQQLAGADAKPSAPVFDAARFAGVFAAVGLALGAIGSTLAAVTAGFLGLVWWQMPLVIAGAVLVVSGPSTLIAWLKLRNRSLGPLLDANGWAVNARATLNIPFGASLTAVAQLPRDAERRRRDPYAPRPSWPLRLLVAALAAGAAWAWWAGLLGG